jgi:hypothetical protein
VSEILYDRSRVVADWKCPRYRYWTYEYKGKGIVPDYTQLELFLGTAVHDGLAAIARGIDIEDIITAGVEEVKTTLLRHTENEAESEYFSSEQAALVEGLLRGFHKHVWPRLEKQYPEIVCIEQEMVYKHDGLSFMAKPDLVVRDKEGGIWYIEHKTTSSNRDQWINSWSTAVQLHSTVKAIQEAFGEPVTGVIVQGLYKGYQNYGKQTSPLCYSYRRAGNPPLVEEKFRYDYLAGYRKFPVWDMEGGVKQWIEKMPTNILASQFPQAPPIFINEDLVNAFFRQRAVRETEIHDAMDLIQLTSVSDAEKKVEMDEVFGQKFDQCSPGWGHSCSCKKLCFSGIDDPLQAGFMWREPHHQPELDRWKNDK